MFGMFKRKLALVEAIDRILFEWSPGNPFTVRNLLNGGILTLGISGGGKTSSSGKMIAQSILNNHNLAIQIHGAKPECRSDWTAMYEKSGRARKLIIFGPGEKARFNILHYLTANGADARELTQFLMTMSELLKAREGGGGGDDSAFFEDQNERLLYNGIVVLRLARGSVSAPELQDFIIDAAATPQQINEPNWRKGFHVKCLMDAARAAKDEIMEADFRVAEAFWLGEWPQMADKTKSSILAGVMGLLFVLNTGLVRQLVSTTTTITPQTMLAEGQCLLVDAPVTKYGASGKIINGIWKYALQWSNLRRHAKSGDYVSVIWSDECHNILNSFDNKYLAECRSHLGCMVLITQSLHSLFGALSKKNGEHQVEALLANTKHRIFHALGDKKTAEYASDLIGKARQIRYGGSSAPTQGIFEEMFGQGQVTGNFSERTELIIEPREFMSGLRTGGPQAGFICDAIVVRTGEPFANGQNFLRVAFSQR